MAVRGEQPVMVITFPLNAASTKFTSPEGLPIKDPLPLFVVSVVLPHFTRVNSHPSGVGSGDGSRVGPAEGLGKGCIEGLCVGV